MKLYRIARGILAGTATTVLVLAALWHLLVWRMGCVYRELNETARRQNAEIRNTPTERP